MSGFSYAHAVLRAVAGAGEAGFAEISRACNDPVAATLSRTLKGLIAEGLIERTDSGRYRPGPALTALAGLLAGGRQARIEEACRRLAEATGQSALCCALLADGAGMERIAKQEVAGGMSYGPLHQPMRLLAMGFGIALLPALPPEQQDHVVAQHLAATGEPAAELAACRSQIAARGVLVRGEVLQGQALGCTRIAATVPGHALALGITLFARPEQHHGLDALTASVVAEARRLAEQLPQG